MRLKVPGNAAGGSEEGGSERELANEATMLKIGKEL